jgi:hypothetical protein
MARFAFFLLLILIVSATPASASVSAAWSTQTWPPIWQPYQRIIGVDGSDAVNHDIVVKPSGSKQLYGYPQKVDIYDYADTFVPATWGRPCQIISTHHAVCTVSGGPHYPNDSYSYDSFARIQIGTGDGNDSVTVSDPLNPMIVSLSTGDGDDSVEISGMWGYHEAKAGGDDYLGPGNDFAHIGPAAPPTSQIGASGAYLWGGTGDDTIETLNASIDHVHCEEGTDSWQADPADDQQTFPYGGPPDTNGDCESRTPPEVSAP